MFSAIFAENERKEIEMTKAKADAVKRNFKSKRPTKCRKFKFDTISKKFSLIKPIFI